MLNRTTRDSYAASTLGQRSSQPTARRASVGLNAQSPVNRAPAPPPRGLQSPLCGQPGAEAPGVGCANVLWFDLVLWTTFAPSHLARRLRS